MKYASVCSGVEAASLAWMPLGWEAVWFSEIEPFPCAVLQERFPGVPNLGDMTKIKVENLKNGDQKFTSRDGTVVTVPGGVDLLVGGTPCQSFSVAGKREGLDGASGLARSFVELLGVMRPRWFVWENVPGCLSSRNKQTGIYDFNFLLAAFAEVGYSCGWKIYDAQYVRVDGYPRAVPQRRRRLFIVGHSSGDWRYPAEVLFEPSCLRRITPPNRVNWKGTASDAQRCLGTASAVQMRAGFEGGTPIVLNDQGGSVMQVEQDGNAGTLRANTHGNEQIVCVHGSQYPCFNSDHANSVQMNNGLENVVCAVFSGNTGGAKKLAYTQNASGVMGAANSATVRRLLPVECERLMGFPDNWTRIPWKGKPAEDCPDSPRYKACGNSMCVNVMRWIGLRIELVERGKKDE